MTPQKPKKELYGISPLTQAENTELKRLLKVSESNQSHCKRCGKYLTVCAENMKKGDTNADKG